MPEHDDEIVYCEHEDYVQVDARGLRVHRCRKCACTTYAVGFEPAALGPWAVDVGPHLGRRGGR